MKGKAPFVFPHGRCGGWFLAMSVFGAYAYVAMIYYDWKGELVDENEAPGSAS